MAKTKGKVGKGPEKLADEVNLAEECGDDDDASEHKMVEEKDSVKRVPEKATKPGKPQQKVSKEKAVDSKDEVKSDRVKPEQSKQSKVSHQYVSLRLLLIAVC